MFLFGLQHWISPHFQLVAKLVLSKFRPSAIFSGAPETSEIIGFQLDQFLHECIYLLHGGRLEPIKTGVAAFFHVAP